MKTMGSGKQEWGPTGDLLNEMGKVLPSLCASVSSSAKQASNPCPAPRGRASTHCPGWPWSTRWPWDCRDHCWGTQRPDADGDMEWSQPKAHLAMRKEQRSPFLIPYTNSQKYIFALAHMSSHTKPFLPFGVFFLHSCPECYQLVWAGGKIFKALKCLLLKEQQPFLSPIPVGFQWVLGYPSAWVFLMGLRWFWKYYHAPLIDLIYKLNIKWEENLTRRFDKCLKGRS